MALRFALLIAVIAALVLCVFSAPAPAQPLPREPELADQIDTLVDRASTEANQQKFLSILVFVVLGGAATYAVMRGIRKLTAA